MGIREVLTAPQSPWQNAYVERLIGSIRRECLDHVIIIEEAGPASHFERIFSVLRAKPDSFVSREGHATQSPRGATGIRRYCWRFLKSEVFHHRYERACS